VIRLWVGDVISSTATVAFATKERTVVIDTLGTREFQDLGMAAGGRPGLRRSARGRNNVRISRATWRGGWT
jgi:hypothetical protein